MAREKEAKQREWLSLLSDGGERIKKQAKHDEEARQREREQIKRNIIIEKHKNRLVQEGKQYLGVRTATSSHRANHCYSCKHPVDNAYDAECAVCGWIVCGTCGACKCGYGGNM